MNRAFLAIALIVVVAAVAVYFYWTQSKTTLPTYYVSLSTAWKNANYDQELLHEDPESLIALDNTQLDTIKNSLESKQNELKDATQQEIVGVYVSYVELAQEIKKLQSIDDQLSALDNACENKAIFLSFADELMVANEKLKTFAEKANSLDEAGRKEAEKIHLFSVGNEYQKRIVEFQNLKSEYTTALGVCP